MSGTVLNITFGLIALAAIVGVVGLVLLVRGLRGRIINTHPTCRRCSYDLSGNKDQQQSDACPECGNDLSARRAMRIGARKKRPIMASIGALMLIAGVAGCGWMSFQQLRGFEWLQLMPDSYLAENLNNADASLAARARKELLMRVAAGSVDVDLLASIGADLLDRQADLAQTWDAEFGRIIEHALDQGALNDEDALRYMSQMLPTTTELIVNERTRATGPLPAKTPWIAPRGSDTERFEFVWAEPALFIDDQPVQWDSAGRSVQGVGSVSTAPDKRYAFSVDATVPASLTSGDHAVRTTWSHRIIDTHQVFMDGPANVAATATTEVAAATSIVFEQVQELAEPGAVRGSMNLAVRAQEGRDAGTWELDVEVMASQAPCNLAFTVTLLIDGTVYEVGQCAVALGDSVGTDAAWYARNPDQDEPLPCVVAAGIERVTVILRSDPRAAESLLTKDLWIWGGMVIYEDVPVTPPNDELR